MELTDVIHSTGEEMYEFKPDIFIAGSGYESRAISIPDKLTNLSCKKFTLAFTEYAKEATRLNNDLYFQENNYEFIVTAGDKNPDFNIIFRDFDQDDLKVMIDISVMTRVWYHALLKYLNNLHDFSSIQLKIVYCPAIFSTTPKIGHKILLSKFSISEDYRQKSTVKKKTALILGMGTEKRVSQVVYDKFKPEKAFLLYADPAIQKEYVQSIFVNNHELINSIPIQDLKGYPLNNTREIYKILIDLILPLREEYKIVLVPQGPKIFSLVSMIFQITYPDIEIYFPHFKRRQIQDRKPSDEIATLDLLFESE